MALALYRIATRALTPAARIVLDRRVRRGKEDAGRLDERWGRTHAPRPSGALAWLHGASVGESLSLLPIVERLLARDPALQILVTSGTVTSARLLAGRLPVARARHQYLPLDTPEAVGRFLDHWRPDLAIWVESELWPNLILETKRRGIAMALLNARMSTGSWRRWRRLPGLARRILGAFDLILAQDETQAGRLKTLGARDARAVGDLKAANAPLAVAATELTALRDAIRDRPVWLAASTHPGEEEIAAAAHLVLCRRFPGLLTIIAPRHPARAMEVSAMLGSRDLKVATRSSKEMPGAETDILLVDTLGELGLFYRLAPITLIGGSFGAPGTIGGHNPFEPARLGCALLHGPDMANCLAAAASLDAAGGALALAGPDALVDALAGLLADRDRVLAIGARAQALAEAAAGVADLVFDRLAPLLTRIESRAGA